MFLWSAILSLNSNKLWIYKPIPFEDVLTILVSIFFLLRDERKGRESVRLTWSEKRGREVFDPNGIGLYGLYWLNLNYEFFMNFELLSKNKGKTQLRNFGMQKLLTFCWLFVEKLNNTPAKIGQKRRLKLEISEFGS